jgi:tyrosinase
MSLAPKTRKSVPLTEAVAVDTRRVNVAVEGLDRARIPGSFKVHLLKDGQRIASRFLFQASGGPGEVESPVANRLAHFDFLLPIETVANGKLSVVVEPVEPNVPGERVALESMDHPTMSVYLMLETE